MRRGELDVAVWITHCQRTGQVDPRRESDQKRVYASGKREFARQQALLGKGVELAPGDTDA